MDISKEQVNAQDAILVVLHVLQQEWMHALKFQADISRMELLSRDAMEHARHALPSHFQLALNALMDITKVMHLKHALNATELVILALDLV
jgi:hypothetical protein